MDPLRKMDSDIFIERKADPPDTYPRCRCKLCELEREIAHLKDQNRSLLDDLGFVLDQIDCGQPIDCIRAGIEEAIAEYRAEGGG